MTKMKRLQSGIYKTTEHINLEVMSIIMNYLPKCNGKGNCLKSRFVSPVKMLKCCLDPSGTTQLI